ncbi:MAG: hypothetical protein WCX82_04030 [archaeon]|jgi:hypothetical protein
MNKTKELNLWDFKLLFVAALLFALRYVKISRVDFGFLGETYISFVQEIKNCTLPIINATERCSNVSLINTIFWIVFGILILIQLIILYNKIIVKK